MGITNLNSTKSMENVTKENNKVLQIIKGSAIAIVLSFLFLLAYATILAYTDVPETTIVPVVIVITGISILMGSSMSTLHIKNKGLINGSLVGLIYMLTLYLLSSIVSGNFALNMNSIIMLCVGILTGMIGGIIGVNLKK